MSVFIDNVRFGRILSPVRTLPPEFLIDGCVLCLKFDEGSGTIAHDSSPYHNDGTIVGATWTDGRFGKALYFDGVDDYVKVAKSTSITPTSAITIVAWVKPSSFASTTWGNSIVVEHDPDSGANGYLLRTGAGGHVDFMLGDGAGWHSVSVDNIISTDNWYHIVGTFNGSIMKLYVNGKEVGSISASFTIGYGDNDWLGIGIDPAFGRYFYGKIAEVMVFNRALSDEEIKALYKGSRVYIKR